MKKFFALLTFVGFVSFPGALAGFSLRDLDPPKSFPRESANYRIRSVQPSPEEPGFLQFEVTAPHATYTVEGLAPLHKLSHEVEVIEQVKRGVAGSGFAQGVGDSIVATGKGAVNLVAHPVQSVKQVRKAAGKVGRAVGRVFRPKEEGEKTTFGEKVLGASEREIADKLGVDVYTNNPHLKRLIREMAKARLGGKGVTAVGKFFIPTVGVAAIAITAAGINGAADQVINDLSRPDLFQANQEALLALGFAGWEVNQLLNLPYYSPREATYFRFYLEKLKAIPGYREVMKTAREAKSWGEARKIFYEAQIAAASVKEASKYTRIRCFPEGLVLEEPGRLIFITPYDYLDQSPLGEQVVARIFALKSKWGKPSAEIWNGGRITARFAAFAFSKGIKIRSWLLFL